MSHLTLRQRELSAIGASLASNCIPCIKYHVQKGREAGLTDEEIVEAIEVADAVRRVPSRRVQEAAQAALGHDSPRTANAEGKPACGDGPEVSRSPSAVNSSCCGPGASS
jgi:4-carboxymuconolactone decarboxylase